eukprot:scaffold103005_cov17-Tisochrysis_lutea.AAC.2
MQQNNRAQPVALWPERGPYSSQTSLKSGFGPTNWHRHAKGPIAVLLQALSVLLIEKFRESRGRAATGPEGPSYSMRTSGRVAFHTIPSMTALPFSLPPLACTHTKALLALHHSAPAVWHERLVLRDRAGCIQHAQALAVRFRRRHSAGSCCGCRSHRRGRGVGCSGRREVGGGAGDGACGRAVCMVRVLGW